MSSTDFTRTPACNAAEASLKRIVTGEAGAREREEFSTHLATCPHCNRTLSGVLALTCEVRTALASAAARFPEAPPLVLPDRAGGGRPRLRVLTDFVLLLVLGLGLFVLIALAFFGYRSNTETYDSIRLFRAVQGRLVLTHLCERARAREPAVSLQALPSRVRLDAVRLLGPDSIVDPWGTPYIIAVEDARLVVRSAGPNRVDEGGSGDDITSRAKAPALGRPPRTPSSRSP